MTEQEVKDATNEHIDNVRNLMYQVMHQIQMRATQHDLSKLLDPEFPIFVKYTPKLAGTTYGSEEYKQYLSEMKPALDHHYSFNRHHPEHHDDGIDGMNLVDLIEMFCDWKAATMRHNNGDITTSIEINRKRFGISDQLANILQNTADALRTE